MHFANIISHLDPHWPHTFSILQTEHWVMGRQNRLHACFTGLVMGVAFRFFIWFFEHSFPFLTQLEIRRRQLDHRILQLEKSSWNSGIEGSSIVLWGPPSEVTCSASVWTAPCLLTTYLELWQVGNSLGEFLPLSLFNDEWNEPGDQKKTNIFNQELYLLVICSLLKLNTHIHTHAKQSPNVLIFSCH